MALDGPVDAVGKPSLRIKVVRASGLRKADPLPFTSDPFCVIEVSGNRWQTPVVKNTLEPVWDFVVETTAYELGDRLLFSVYDHDRIGKNDLLGRHNMSCADWGYPLGFKGEIPLFDPKDKRSSATLEVELGPLPPVPINRALKGVALKEGEEVPDVETEPRLLIDRVQAGLIKIPEPDEAYNAGAPQHVSAVEEEVTKEFVGGQGGVLSRGSSGIMRGFCGCCASAYD